MENSRELSPTERSRMSSFAEGLTRDGAVLIPNALGANDLAVAKELYDWTRTHPSPAFMSAPIEGGVPMIIDTHSRAARAYYRELLRNSSIPAVAATVMGLDELWFLGEQLFEKVGPAKSFGTPWHQDIDLPIDSRGVVGMWISFDTLDSESSLSFVRGSHTGPRYNPVVRSDDGKSQRLLFPAATDMPSFPDIDADRQNFDLVSWAYQPGDVILFNNMIIHGGAPIPPGGQRRTLCLRFFGPDVMFWPVPVRQPNGNLSVEATEYLFEDLAEGMPIRRGKHFFPVFTRRAQHA